LDLRTLASLFDELRDNAPVYFKIFISFSYKKIAEQCKYIEDVPKLMVQAKKG